MPVVIKRTGAEQAFDAGKIRTSLIAASDEAGQPLNEGDITAILADMKKLLEGRGRILSQHIYIMLLGVLYAGGFYPVAKAYRESARNCWK